jgi:hypothetical protein
VRGLGGKELGAEVSLATVGITTLAGLAELELGVGWEETLVVRGTAVGFFASGLKGRQLCTPSLRVGGLTGSKVGLWAVVILAAFPDAWMGKLES